MSERVRRAASSRGGRRVLKGHASAVERGADIGAKSFGLAWLYFVAVFVLIMVVAWIVAIVFGGYYWFLAAAVTLAVLPPTVREFRKRDEVRRALGHK